MTPEQLTVALVDACPCPVRSVLLYGSAAAGDHTGKGSDYNILVIAEKLDVEELKALAGPTRKWVDAGNPPPLLFTLDRLRRSADSFPIELLDIQESHQILHGDDLVADLDVSTANLRLQLEHELKSALIRLRERFLLTGARPKAIVELMVHSLSTFLVLFRAALRMRGGEVPRQKLEALRELSRRLDFDPAPFETLEAIKQGRRRWRDVDAEELFHTYISGVEAVVDAIDLYEPAETQGEDNG